VEIMQTRAAIDARIKIKTNENSPARFISKTGRLLNSFINLANGCAAFAWMLTDVSAPGYQMLLG
jgi:hypothetical protein